MITKLNFPKRVKIYYNHPKYMVDDINIYISKQKERMLFAVNKKIINYFLNSKKCKYHYNLNADDKFNSAILFPCTVVSKVLEEHFKNIDRLKIHGIDVNTQMCNVIIVTIKLTRPGLLIGKYGTDIDCIKKRLCEVFGRKIQIEIEEVKDINVDKIYRYS